jgi:iron(III) transport system substrate-binding protein
MRRWQIGCAFILCVVLLQGFAAKPEAATSEARPASPAEWERMVEAAKKEGVVQVAGPPGAYRRAPLVEFFEKAFPGIKVEYTPLAGAKFVPRLKLERAAGQRFERKALKKEETWKSRRF